MVVLEVCLGSLSCWNTALRPSLRREGIMLCFSMSQYMLAFMVPSMNHSSLVPEALMQPQTMTIPPPCLAVGKTDLSLYSLPGFRLEHAWHHLNQISLSWSHQTTGHGSSNPCAYLQQTFCRLSSASSLEEASFWDDSHADQFDAVCGVWSEHWQADPPPLQPLQQCWQHSYAYFPKHNLWIWCWACALNFFGRPWRGLFWVEPVLLYHCIVLAT